LRCLKKNEQPSPQVHAAANRLDESNLSTSDVTKKAELSGDELFQEGRRIVDDAKKQSFTLRLTGGIAIFNLIEKNVAIKELLIKNRKAGRSSTSTFADLDLVGYSKETKKLNALFLEQYKFQKDKIINALFGDRRRIYYHPQGTFHVDVFLDKLEFNHDIDIRGRLELDYPNLNPDDLLLTKLQIHYVNDKDLLDIIALLTVDTWKIEERQRVLEILSSDWGFCYDAINNLKASAARIKELSNEPMAEPSLSLSAKRIQDLLEKIETSQKSKEWNKAAKRGANKQWWREIEDVVR
jgi:hypothetical protein